MAFCTNCGSNNEDYADFCGTCGTKIQSVSQEQPAKGFQEPTQSYQPETHDYQQPTKGYQQGYPTSGKGYQQGYQPGHRQGYSPGLLPPRTGWLTFVIVLNWIGIILGGIIGVILLLLFPPFGIIILIFVALGIWIVKELAKYNNTARILSIVLTVIGALGNLSNGDLIGLVFAGLIIYALAFDKETVALFKLNDMSPFSQPMQRY